MNIISNEIGLVHLIASILALVFGTMILMMAKGSNNHKRVGYAYVISMVVLLATSFMLYNLFGGFGIFHFASIVSSVTLAAGMVPAIKKGDKWVIRHFSWMYWSVIGLYAAFASEIFTRVFPSPFFSAVGYATGLIMLIGGLGFRLNIKRWEKSFYREISNTK